MQFKSLRFQGIVLVDSFQKYNIYITLLFLKLSVADMTSSENLYQLFRRIFDKTTSKDQIFAVASLLDIWPPFEAAQDDEGVWYLVFAKLISDAKDGFSVVEIAREKADSIRLNKKVRTLK